MKQRLLILSISLLVFSNLQVFGQDLVPIPVEYQSNDQEFTLSKTTRLLFSTGLGEEAAWLAEALSPATGWDFVVEESNQSIENSIFLKLDKTKGIPEEGYELSAGSKGVIITGGTPAGVFYGLQTFLQMLPPQIYNQQRQKEVEWKIKGAEIADHPQYPWRGMMLDVSRYFFGKHYVLKFIDMMTMYKLNKLHLHLIDDAGWRLEIKKYPRLTSVGGFRGEGIERTGGYYTPEDIKEIVAYAAARNIEVIPEIEVPAHTLAAIAAYPFLSCREEAVEVQTEHSISKELYCVGKESTFEFLADVLAEAFALFPGKYIHVGGDEARYDRWAECPHCQKRKADLGLETEAELQVYFNRRMQEMAAAHGKTILGWDEIIEEGLKEKAVGMIWHNKEKTFAATKMGHEVVMALTAHAYFDVPESDLPGEVKGATWLPPISLQQVYRFDPMIEGLEDQYRGQVLGGQACLWSDQFIHGTVLQEIEALNENRSEKYFDYLAFPRMSALAEVLWSPRSRQDWAGFEQRMRTHYRRYDQAGYGYRVPLPKVVRQEQLEDGYLIELESLVAGAQIRYTTDGIKPNAYSTVYTGPVKVKDLKEFQAITVVNRRQFSLPLILVTEKD